MRVFLLNPMIESLRRNIANEKDMTREEMEFFLSSGISGDITEANKIEILTLQNNKGISADEISFAVDYLRKRSNPLTPLSDRSRRQAYQGEAIDICGTGGSGLPRINTSTLSAFVLPALGVKIGKHGNRAASGRFGSFDLLEKLGINIDLTPEQSEKVLDQTGLGFFFAPKCFPEIGAFMLARKCLAVPTMFNLLGPLLSPLNPKRQIIGTSNEKNAELLIHAAKNLGKERVFVVVGEAPLDKGGSGDLKNGLDEVTLTGETQVWELSNPLDKGGMGDSKIQKYTLSPEDFGLEAVSFDEISGGTPEKNIQISEDFLNGNITDTPHANLIHINVALALKLVGEEDDLKKGVEMSKEAVNSGKAKEIQEEMIKVTQEF